MFADFGEADVGCGILGVGGDGCVELLFGFGQQVLRHVVAANLGVFDGLLGRRQGGEAEGANLVELEGGLAETGLGVGATETSGGLEAVGGFGRGAASGDEGLEFGGFDVGGVELEGLVDVAVGSGEVASAELGDGEVVVVVGIVGVGGDGLGEVGGTVFALASSATP